MKKLKATGVVDFEALGINPEEMSDEQREIAKSWGLLGDTEETGDVETELDALQKRIDDVRKNAGAKALAAETEDDTKSAADATKVAKRTAVKGDVALTEEAVFGELIKNADGDFVQLIDADPVLSDLVKSFSKTVADQNTQLAEVQKTVTDQATLITMLGAALLRKSRDDKEVYKTILGALALMPIDKTAQGAVLDAVAALSGTSKEVKSETETVDKNTGTTAAGDKKEGDPVADKYLGLGPGGLALAVKERYDDPTVRKSLGVDVVHIELARRGVGSLPKKLVKDIVKSITGDDDE